MMSASRRYKVRLYRMKTQEVAVFYGGGHHVNPGGILLDGRFLHNHCPDSNSVCWRLLGRFSATQRYKVRPYAIKTDEVVVFCKGSTLTELYSMADTSTTATRIPILFFGGCWARRRLSAGIRYVSTPSILMELLSALNGVPGRGAWKGNGGNLEACQCI